MTLKLLLGVRGEVEAALQCGGDQEHLAHHLNGALSMLDGVEKELEVVIETTYKAGFAAAYAKQVIAEMKGEAEGL